MDRYTLMASKCKLLQEEKVLGFKDEVWYRGEIYTIINIVSSYPISLYTIKSENYNEMLVVPPKELIYRPTLEQLIEMLGERKRKDKNMPWTINYIANIAYRKVVDKGYRAWDYLDKPYYYGKSPQEALLKFVAYERWGLRYNEEKETWEEG